MTKEQKALPGKYRRRIQIGLGTSIVGLLFFIVGARPEWFGLTANPVIGYVQISLFIISLGIICLGSVVAVYAFWQDYPKSIIHDIGLRILATGFVVSAVSAFADMIGLGTRPLPYLPYFGHWQSRGVLLGMAMVIIGILMMFPYQLWLNTGDSAEE